jgi:hypothetical protein
LRKPNKEPWWLAFYRIPLERHVTRR